ncbi:type IIL restriction-modification enzyme MmeI, partial [Microbacterium algeriense]|uniref:type IIL restriction-modification enzyme MmeI n=1 Tax=Microbacterium algeriense TaxID=2615184 RepID=UPI0029B63F5F
IARVSKTVMPLRVPTGSVPSEACVVFTSVSHSAQAVLSSSLHQMWAITYGSTLETRVRYTPSDVFETFPLPAETARLSAAGASLDDERREIMLRRDLGLTKLYNLVNDPNVTGDMDVDRMRELHAEVDVSAMAAYGWDDVIPNHGFYAYRQAERWTIDPACRVEVLDRLLELNRLRAPAANGSARGGGRHLGRLVDDSGGTLFD